jgi:hypothetical protein
MGEGGTFVGGDLNCGITMEISMEVPQKARPII